MLIGLYLLGLILITLVIGLLYYYKERDSQYELEKIKTLEEKIQTKNTVLENIRSKTQGCPINNLNDPRSCYIGSNKTCSWNEQAERCDKK